MTLDIQTVLIVLLANAVATAVALPVIMGWQVSLAARAFQGASVAQALGWLAFLVATVQGGSLTASMMGNRIMLVDAKGGMSHVTQGDVMQSNGVIHVVDAVLMPRM